MRIAVTLVIDLTDQQVADYADDIGLPVQPTGHFRARDIVDSVRGFYLTAGCNAADTVGSGATVTLKER